MEQKKIETIGGNDSNILAVEDCPSLTVVVSNLTGDYGIKVRHSLTIVTVVKYLCFVSRQRSNWGILRSNNEVGQAHFCALGCLPVWNGNVFAFLFPPYLNN